MVKTLFLALGFAICAAGVGAQGTGMPPAGVAEVSILPGWRTEQGTHMSALRIRLAPGWKTYWRAPGETGIPPRFDWSGSRNVRSVAFHWPVPTVTEQDYTRTIGYTEELVLPMEFTPERPDEDISLRAAVEFGVCYDVCLPMQASIDADLHRDGAADARIRAAIARRPFSAAEAGVGPVRCEVEPIRDGMRVTATLPLSPLGRGEVVVFEHPDQSVWVAEAEAERTGHVLTARTEMVAPTARPFTIDRSQIRITVFGDGQAVDIQGCTG